MTTTESTAGADLSDLRERMRGPVLAAGDPGYDQARAVWNARFEGRPAAVARCAGAADVIAAVDFVRARELPFAIKSGGHDYSGNSTCDGELVIDLSGMQGIRVDPRTRRAWVQPGVRMGALDHESQAFALATTGGTVSTVGVAGFLLGGGTGHLSRRLGIGADNVRSVDLVTADGELVRASDDENGDLFWAVRGGGGNFGVVTSFELALYPVGPTIAAGQILYPLERAGEVLRAYRDFMAAAPDHVQCYAAFMRLPAVPDFPAAFHGRVVLALVVVDVDPPSDGGDVFGPLRRHGEPILEAITPQPYLAAQQMFDPGMPAGHRWCSRAHCLPELGDGAIETILARIESLPGELSMAYFEPYGGAIARVGPSATAFPHRDAAYSVHLMAGWSDPVDDDEVLAWCRSFHEALAPEATGGVYVNLLSREEEDRVVAAYAGNHERLRQLKLRFDPGNLFRSNHNIEPAATT